MGTADGDNFMEKVKSVQRRLEIRRLTNLNMYCDHMAYIEGIEDLVAVKTMIQLMKADSHIKKSFNTDSSFKELANKLHATLKIKSGKYDIICQYLEKLDKLPLAAEIRELETAYD